ncbi:uncharacterized protein LOC128652183 [Bombina bombina]|uniref:uncharacterized protein LOC128652183 n=1 Tax=Bombina bombina TaxID=8345 RepID=UPI00235AF4F6|nr:uncharacterized protein LOC128652183 [Bombina bombina]
MTRTPNQPVPECLYLCSQCQSVCIPAASSRVSVSLQQCQSVCIPAASQCQEPLSEPVLNVTCNKKDGSAVIVCSVKKGTDPKFSLVWNGLSNNSSVIFIHAPVNGNVTCTGQNQLGTKHTQMSAFCPEPLSEPVLNVTCNKKDGSAVIVCSVKKGTDPKFSLVWNGLSNNSSVIFIHAPVNGNVTCTGQNQLGTKHTQMSAFCPGYQESNRLTIHHLFLGVICVMYTVLLVCMVRNLLRGTIILKQG